MPVSCLPLRLNQTQNVAAGGQALAVTFGDNQDCIEVDVAYVPHRGPFPHSHVAWMSAINLSWLTFSSTDEVFPTMPVANRLPCTSSTELRTGRTLRLKAEIAHPVLDIRGYQRRRFVFSPPPDQACTQTIDLRNAFWMNCRRGASIGVPLRESPHLVPQPPAGKHLGNSVLREQSQYDNHYRCYPITRIG